MNVSAVREALNAAEKDLGPLRIVLRVPDVPDMGHEVEAEVPGILAMVDAEYERMLAKSLIADYVVEEFGSLSDRERGGRVLPGANPTEACGCVVYQGVDLQPHQVCNRPGVIGTLNPAQVDQLCSSTFAVPDGRRAWSVVRNASATCKRPPVKEEIPWTPAAFGAWFSCMATEIKALGIDISGGTPPPRTPPPEIPARPVQVDESIQLERDFQDILGSLVSKGELTSEEAAKTRSLRRGADLGTVERRPHLSARAPINEMQRSDVEWRKFLHRTAAARQDTETAQQRFEEESLEARLERERIEAKRNQDEQDRQNLRDHFDRKTRRKKGES